jgi:hypothetical protein
LRPVNPSFAGLPALARQAIAYLGQLAERSAKAIYELGLQSTAHQADRTRQELVRAGVEIKPWDQERSWRTTMQAGCDLLINHATWLHRSDFRDQFVHTGPSITDATTPMAHIDWAAAIDALNAGHLPCTGVAGRVLRLAASLTHGIPVNLNDAVTGLDHTNIDLVVQAIHHAAGRRRA